MVNTKSIKGSKVKGAVEYWLQFTDVDKIEENIHEWNKTRQGIGKSENN